MTKTLLSGLPKKVSDWESLAKVQNLFRRVEIDEPREWVFRGISDGNAGLRTTLEKVAEEFGVANDKIPDLEVKLIFEFMRRYHLYGSSPAPKKGDTLDWLATMRHYGSPSRLLDFTFSFLVAAYFAIEQKPIGVPRVWAINKKWLTDEVPKVLRRCGKDLAPSFARHASSRDGNEFRRVFLEGRCSFVSAVGPFRLNQRLSIQQGLFLCPGDVTKSFDENLKSMPKSEGNILEIPIDSGARPELLVGLFRANLTRETLFPGLDGFASSLWTRVPALKNLKSMEDSGARGKVNLNIRSLGEW
jgi:hypothetical protein